MNTLKRLCRRRVFVVIFAIWYSVCAIVSYGYIRIDNERERVSRIKECLEYSYSNIERSLCLYDNRKPENAIWPTLWWPFYLSHRIATKLTSSTDPQE